VRWPPACEDFRTEVENLLLMKTLTSTAVKIVTDNTILRVVVICKSLITGVSVQ
jgi:hypothetical protein